MMNPLVQKIIGMIFVFVILLLTMFSNLESNILNSIFIIMLFLVIFNFIFSIPEVIFLKFTMLIMSFIILPVFILYFLGIFTIFGFKWGIFGCLLVVFFGIFAIGTIFTLNYLDITYGIGDGFE